MEATSELGTTDAMRRLQIDVPVIQAPMGGGPSTVALAAAVCEAGGLGSLAGGYLGPDRLRSEIRQLRGLTSRPFAVNLFAPLPVSDDPSGRHAALRVLEPLRVELGLPARPDIHQWAEDFDGQLGVVVDEAVPVCSFTFGMLPTGALDRLRRAGSTTMGTATNAAEARALEDAGVDLVCAQGTEAGGHHATWLVPAEQSLIGTMALVPLVRRAVTVPVVAAGGIMDGRGVAAALCLGAGAAQLGTAFMLCPEAGTVPPHRRAIARARDTDVDVTTETTGQLARGVRNRLMETLRGVDVPPYPVMNALTSELRRASAAADDPELMSLWCGQAAPLATERPAADVMAEIVETLRTLRIDLGAAAGQG